jgi:peptide-methionine (R)-S-oxide reductase
LWTKKVAQGASLVFGASALVSWTFPVRAADKKKSRTLGYKVQKTEDKWKTVLSPMQYNVLRHGGTEQPGFSILENEKRSGVYHCAGCGTPLFSSKDKFNSGTGWPSFARGLPGVEVEEVNPIVANLAGAELRCATCGGHLGDVFQDGFLL